MRRRQRRRFAVGEDLNPFRFLQAYKALTQRRRFAVGEDLNICTSSATPSHWYGQRRRFAVGDDLNEGTDVDALPMEHVIILAYVIATNLLASSCDEGEQWWDLLDRAEAAIAASPER